MKRINEEWLDLQTIRHDVTKYALKYKPRNRCGTILAGTKTLITLEPDAGAIFTLISAHDPLAS